METFNERSLTIEVEEAEQVTVNWRGKSTSREPGQFVLPILSKALELGTASNKELVIDFQKLEYMNSSTITPLIRILDQAKRGTARVRVIYAKALKWQSLSFTALQVFKTDDGRIQIVGM